MACQQPALTTHEIERHSDSAGFELYRLHTANRKAYGMRSRKVLNFIQ